MLSTVKAERGKEGKGKGNMMISAMLDIIRHLHIEQTFVHPWRAHGRDFAERIRILLEKRLFLNILEHREPLLFLGIKLFACNCVAPLARTEWTDIQQYAK